MQFSLLLSPLQTEVQKTRQNETDLNENRPDQQTRFEPRKNKTRQKKFKARCDSTRQNQRIKDKTRQVNTTQDKTRQFEKKKTNAGEKKKRKIFFEIFFNQSQYTF